MAKRQHKKKSQATRTGEIAPKERRQHGRIAFEPLDRDSSGHIYIKRQRVLEECRLDTYLLRGYITDGEHKAGIKFRQAYVRSVFGVRIKKTSTNPFLNEAGGGDAEAAVIAGIDSVEWLNKALKMLSPSQRAIAIAVCGLDEFAGTTAKRRTLKRALGKMAKHWGFM